MSRSHYNRNMPASPLSRVTGSSQTLRGFNPSPSLTMSSHHHMIGGRMSQGAAGFSSRAGPTPLGSDSELRRSFGSRVASMGKRNSITDIVGPIKLQRYRTFQRSKFKFKTSRDQHFVFQLQFGGFSNVRLSCNFTGLTIRLLQPTKLCLAMQHRHIKWSLFINLG